MSQVKIDGVLHEFSSIPGVKEDVTEIIMNIKNLAIRNNSSTNEPKVAYIEFEGEGVVTAADIQVDSDIEIMNPELEIAHLNGGADCKLYMELTITKGRGYISADLHAHMTKSQSSKIHMPNKKIDEDDDIQFFNESQLQTLDNYFHGTNAETAYMLGSYCGLRINECYGLKWDHVNLDDGSIRIDRQMQYQEGLIKLVPVKTRNGVRSIFIPDVLVLYLRELRQKIDSLENEAEREQNKTMIIDIDGKQLSSLSLVNCQLNGKIQTNNSMKYHSKKLAGEGLEFKYHWLRHTYGTMMAAMNTPEYLLCSQMGHASSQVTHKYYVALSKPGIDVLRDRLNKL